jgi:hypothetical protein
MVLFRLLTQFAERWYEQDGESEGTQRGLVFAYKTQLKLEVIFSSMIVKILCE